MAKSGPIIIVDDDLDDEELIKEALTEIGVSNKIIHFANGEDAFLYLRSTLEQAFLILCDVNMPKLNGVEFKRKIDEDPELRKKSIPFVFFTTSVDQSAVTESYTKMTVQGFFKKSNSYEELKKLLTLIIDYWKICYHPNT